DLETLVLLEDYLINYTGTLILVSHDRSFLNNIITSSLVYEGDGVVKEYVGNYDDWLRQRPRGDKPAKSVKGENVSPSKAANLKTQFGFKGQKELESLPQTIQEMETAREELYRQMGDPALYKKDKSELASKKERLEEIKESLAVMYARWEELEQLRNKLATKDRGTPSSIFDV